MDGTKVGTVKGRGVKEKAQLKNEALKNELALLYKKYHHAELLGEDPLGLVNGHLSENDFEFVSYVSASLSYGRVEQIRKSLSALWKRLEELSLLQGGEGLHSLLVNNSWKTLKKDFQIALKGWVHRFNDEEDILVLFKTLHRIAVDQRSLGQIYASSTTEHPTEKFQFFVNDLRSYVDKNELALFSWFACSPAEGSTCKRMVMWLRWMLRSDDIDPGLWTKNKGLADKGIGAHLAFIPMDTHIHRWATQNKLLSTKSPSWKAVEELTQFLRTVDPKDPARFDFCICHHGMSQFRTSQKNQSSNKSTVSRKSTNSAF